MTIKSHVRRRQSSIADKTGSTEPFQEFKMGFFDLFRPRWRHSSPEVRANAVRQLTNEDLPIVRELVLHDPDIKIRRLALKKLDDEVLLREIGQSAADETLRQMATERLQLRLLERALGSDPSAREVLPQLPEKALAEVARLGAQAGVRTSAVALLSNEKWLAGVARSADDKEIRSAAAARVKDTNLLRELALSAGNRAVALDAIERLEDPKALEAVVHGARNKAVRTTAKAKLQQIRPPIDPKRREAKAQQDRARAEEAAALRRAEEEARRLREAREKDARRQAERPQVEEVTRNVPEQPAKAAARRLSEERASQEAAEQEAAEKEAAEQEAARRQAERVAKAAELARRADEEAVRRQRLVQACEAMEAVVESDDTPHLRRALKDGEAAFFQVGRGKLGALRERYQAARARLKIRIEELQQVEDWKRWSNVPLFEKLCARAEALLESELIEGREGAKQLRGLQAEWKALGAPPRERSEALWQRFKHACDQLHERNRKQLSLLEEERTANLRRKEALCERAEEVVNSTELQESAETIKRLQEEWKAIGPVPRRAGEAAWERFRRACDRFFERRKAHFAEADEARAKNLEQYLTLCQQAEALQDSTIWKESAERFKALQAEWKTIGPPPRDKSEEIWRRFRNACDHFFEKRKAHFAAADEARAANLKMKEDLCFKIEQLAQAEPVGDLDAKLEEWMSEWKKIGPAPKDQAEAVWARFRTACDRLRNSSTEEAPPESSTSKFENRLPLDQIVQGFTLRPHE
jgi:hypothetical protein